MNPDHGVQERLHAAADPIQVPTEDALTMVGATVAVRRRRRRVGASVVALAIVASFGVAVWLGSRTPGANVPASVGPSLSTLPTDIEVTPPPPGVTPNLTYEEIETFVQAENDKVEQKWGVSLAPFRIVSIAYLEPGDVYPQPGARRRMFGPVRNPSWVVTYEGTVVVCSSWCSGHTPGFFLVTDAATPEIENWSHEDMVCVLREGPDALDFLSEMDDWPSCEDFPKPSSADGSA